MIENQGLRAHSHVQIVRSLTPMLRLPRIGESTLTIRPAQSLERDALTRTCQGPNHPSGSPAQDTRRRFAPRPRCRTGAPSLLPRDRCAISVICRPGSSARAFRILNTPTTGRSRLEPPILRIHVRRVNPTTTAAAQADLSPGPPRPHPRVIVTTHNPMCGSSNSTVTPG